MEIACFGSAAFTRIGELSSVITFVPIRSLIMRDVSNVAYI
jgi:hypothetical protein